MDIAAIANTVEKAVAALASPNPTAATIAEAQEALTSFRSLAKPYSVCEHIITHSADRGAQFQALLTLRAAALRDWGALGPDVKTNLLHLMLRCAIVQYCGDTMLSSTAAGAAAAIFKRGWVEMVDAKRQEILHSIDTMAKDAGGSMDHVAGSLLVMTNIVNEFNPTYASPMGISWSTHEECRGAMQDTYLLGFLQYGLSIANNSLVNDAAMSASLSLIVAILSWHFSRTQASWNDERPAEILALRPPMSWRPVLLAEGAFKWLIPLVGLASEVGTKSRQVLIHLCSLDGEIFEADSKLAHLRRMLSMIIPLTTTRNVDEQVLLDAGRALLAASHVHRLPGFMNAGIEVLPLLSEFVTNVLRRNEDWASDLSSILIDCFAELVVDPCHGARAVSDSVESCLTVIFGAALQREMNMALDDVHEDEIEYEGDEEAAAEAFFANVAQIGRAAAAKVFPELAQHLKACTSELQSTFVPNCQQDPSTILERLCWMLKMSSSVIADSGDGEEPQVPLAVVDACASGNTAPVIELSYALLNVVGVCIENHHAYISPRLMEQVVLSLGTWLDTYLIISVEHPALNAEFGMQGKGPAIADQLMKLAIAALTRFPGERQLHDYTVRILLAAAARQQDRCRVVVRCESFGSICAAVSTRAEQIADLEAGVHRRLLQALCAASAGFSSQEEVYNYIHQLVGVGIVADLIQACSLAGTAQHASRLENLIQSLRGVVIGSVVQVSGLQGILLQTIAPVWEPLIKLFNTMQAQQKVYVGIIKLAADFVEYFGDSVAEIPNAMQALLGWVSSIHATYVKHHRGAVTVASQDEEQYESLCAAIRLFTKLADMDFTPEVVHLVVSGVESIVPLISAPQLQYPKLRHRFFQLLSHTLEHYCQQVAAFPPSCLASLNSAVLYGISVIDDTETASLVCSAVAAMAAFHVSSLRNGGTGFDNEALKELLTAILKRVLLDSTNDSVDFAAEAMLPLIMANPATFIDNAKFLGLESATPAFTHVANVAASCTNFDRATRKQFSGLFREFVGQARASMLVK